MTEKAGITLVGMLVGLTALEALAYLAGGVFEWTAARVWLTMGLGFAILGAIEIRTATADAVRRRDPLPIVMAAVIGSAALCGIGGIDHVRLQHEATLEVAAGLDRWAEPSLGYTGTGHLFYPARQYLIVAAPAQLLGRSVLCLRLGFALAVIFGALVFWAGAARAWRRLPRGPTTATLLTISVFSFPYAVRHLHWYEQTALPLAFTLAAAGWLLVAAHRPSVHNLLGLVWIGSLLGVSYTPALASWVLLLAALAWLARRTPADGGGSSRLGFAAVFASVGVFGVLSLLTRGDLVRSTTDTVRPDPVAAVIEAVSIFALGRPEAFIAPLLVLPVLLTLGLGLAGRLGPAGLAISWWTAAVVGAAVVLTGYGVRDVGLDMHRAQVVIPPLLLLVGWAALRSEALDLGHRAARSGIVVVGVLVTGQAMVTISASFASYQPTARELVTVEILEQFAARGLSADHRAVVIRSSRDRHLENIGDTLEYFLASFLIVDGFDEVPAAVDAAVVIVIADPPVGTRTLPDWVDRGAAAAIRLDTRRVEREVLVWVGGPDTIPAGRVRPSG
jgi:hypothetical protein